MTKFFDRFFGTDLENRDFINICRQISVPCTARTSEKETWALRLPWHIYLVHLGGWVKKFCWLILAFFEFFLFEVFHLGTWVFKLPKNCIASRTPNSHQLWCFVSSGAMCWEIGRRIAETLHWHNMVTSLLLLSTSRDQANLVTERYDGATFDILNFLSNSFILGHLRLIKLKFSFLVTRKFQLYT